jgi:CheY-like chemotaxis protein
VRVAVADTGQGIAPEFLPFVFHRFRQADGSTTRAHGGLGLGLAIVRQLVEMHGGTVNAESAGAGRGATFIVELPVMAAGPGAAQPPPVSAAPGDAAAEGAAPALDPATALADLRVLLVDDEPDARLLLTTVLEQHGARVLAVASAPQALAALAAFQPDILVSDIGMPGEDGYSLQSALARARGRRARARRGPDRLRPRGRPHARAPRRLSGARLQAHQPRRIRRGRRRTRGRHRAQMIRASARAEVTAVGFHL